MAVSRPETRNRKSEVRSQNGARWGGGAVLPAFAALLGIACSGGIPGKTLGPLREVTVVSEYWELVDSTLTHLLQRPVPTPQPEPEYRIRTGRPDRFDTYSRFRIVMLVGTTRDSLVRAVLGAEADSLPVGDFGLYKVPNPWLQDQFALIFVARDPSLLVQGLRTYAARIRRTLEEIVLEQMRRAVYFEGTIPAVAESMLARYSFALDVPKRWQVREEFADSGFVYMFVHYPDRSVFVYWVDSTQPLEPEALVQQRNRLTGRFYDGDSIDRQFTVVDTVEFLAGPAVRLRGVWRNDRETIGGPFVTYAFNHQGRFYMVDGLVFNPGKKKLDHLLQVEAVVRSCTPR
ncbi:MAG: DUF4837 family protein [candidate division WOR-3 bacterium]